MNNILIKNCTLISMSNKRPVIEKNIDIEIKDGFITKVDKIIDNDSSYIIDGTKKIVLPGFINAHTHLPMSLFGEASIGNNLQDWLKNKILPIEKNLTSEEIYYGSLLSCIEMIENGITCANDHYFDIESIIKACNETGLEVIETRYLSDEDGLGEDRLNEFKDIFNKYKDKNIKLTLGIHSLYTCSEEYIKKVTDYAKENDLTVHMHFCENKEEVINIKEIYNVEHPSLVLKKYFQGLKLILAHGVKLDQYDIDILKEMNASIVHCPISNMMLGSGIADIKKLQENNLNIALGTDGQGSGNNTNMLETIRFTSLIQKGINEQSSLLNPYEVLKLATINGAKALGLENELGSIEEGKRASLTIFNEVSTQMMPERDIVASVVYNANSSDIKTVIINGKIIMENNIIKNINKEEIFEKCQQIVNKLFQ